MILEKPSDQYIKYKYVWSLYVKITDLNTREHTKYKAWNVYMN